MQNLLLQFHQIGDIQTFAEEFDIWAVIEYAKSATRHVTKDGVEGGVEWLVVLSHVLRARLNLYTHTACVGIDELYAVLVDVTSGNGNVWA